MIMKLFLTALLVLGAVGAAEGQETAAPGANEKTADLPGPVAASLPKPSSVRSFAASGAAFLRAAQPLGTGEAPFVSTALALPDAAADPAAPRPEPKFLYSRDDIVRWELSMGINWLRFRSSIFNASAVGLKTSLVYNTNEWFGVEGNITADFAPEIYRNEHVKILTYGAGPKIAWHRYKRWDPWLHALIGGAHEQPQTAGNGRNGFALQLGGGADYNFNSRFSGRLDGNFVRTSFFGQSQNNFQLGAGVVVHF